MHVLICPDKFKGTLTATQAAEAIAAGWRQGRPEDTLESVPTSDGGDGFGDLLGREVGAEEHTVETVDAAHQPLRASWWWAPRSKLAVIESARIIGLALLPAERFHPFELDTFGLGSVLRAARQMCPRTCLVGIGGSATNDGGFGVARALGWQFLDRHDRAIVRWTDLPDLRRILRPARPLAFQNLIVAVDVRNRLLGKYGATRIYGPQKGLRPEDFAPAERCLRRLVRVLTTGPLHYRYEPHHLPGTGAAGGLGFGLRCFAGARIESGFKLFATYTGLKRRLRAADLVITGEGAIDLTTVSMGKGVGRIARICHRPKIPCIGLAGAVQASAMARSLFTELRSIVPDLAPVEAAKREAAHWLAELARRVAVNWHPPAALNRDERAIPGQSAA